jgi:hypothetical protein
MGLKRDQRRAQTFRGSGGILGSKHHNNISTENNTNNLLAGNNSTIGVQKLKYDEILRGIGLVDGGRGYRKQVARPVEEAAGWEDEDMTEDVHKSLAAERDRETSTRIGDMKRDRPDGVFRLMAGKVNNMSNSMYAGGRLEKSNKQ